MVVKMLDLKNKYGGTQKCIWFDLAG